MCKKFNKKNLIEYSIKSLKKSKYVKNGSIDISKELFLNGICLPSGSSLSEKDQDRIIDIILSLSTK